ncbi:SPOR domain-containing protein [Congregibacter variabilis]|uniref:SPOR domain-containing protein n=1 Tax=Congregibacter variabilis TaxID=3081200 RepID=A0ABZ0I129_9GAMM|nr:SPOR domain-containing protein [Congregibacter sp. IMCC43200]
MLSLTRPVVPVRKGFVLPLFLSWSGQFCAVSLFIVWQLGLETSAEDFASPVAAEVSTKTTEVAVPLRLDYPLLQQLLVAELFTQPGVSRELLSDPSACSEIVLSEPVLSPRDTQLEVLADLRAKIGVGANGACATLLSWEGRIGVAGIPETMSNGTSLGFVPEHVWLLSSTGVPVSNDRLLQLAQSSVRSMFSQFTVDLAPQLQSVKTLLPEALPRHSRGQIQALLDTLRLGDLRVTPESLETDILFVVDAASEPLQAELALSNAELARWEERWQLMDSVLVLAVKHYAAATQLQVLRDALLDVLIESRYRLRDALVEAPDAEGDAVRAWFLQSWQALAPVIRRIGLEQPGQEPLLLFSVVASTDALAALDELGPSIGLDISADGLRRLARMINGDAGDALLQYSDEVDPELRSLLEGSLEAASPPSAWRLDFSLFSKAMAATPDSLNSWAPKREDLPEYLPQVAALLEASASTAMAKKNLDPAYEELFRRLVLTTAWQESCWRHYVVSDDRKLVPLRSGTGDVGLMQINERVWRGFYSQQQLRWDIGYNSIAGAEVLLDYLLKYAIRKGEHKQPGGAVNLARASYSAYNGGPSKISRYRSSKASAYGKKVDAAFWEKYQQVAAGDELAVSRCLGGDLSGPAVASRSSSQQTRAPRGGTASQAPEYFTLQLGAFSAEESAASFIATNALAAKARVQRRSKGDTGQYLVIYGSYATRAQADQDKERLAKFQPWVRRFGDL